MREIKFRAWIPADEDEPGYMVNGDELAFEEYAPLCDLLSREGIMQYTGLRDKNGVEIYEGDVVRDYWDGYLWIVVWDEWGGFVLVDPSGTDELEFDEFEEENKTIGLDVLGNIYEHPDLLSTN